jgi:hypothetical protein
MKTFYLFIIFKLIVVLLAEVQQSYCIYYNILVTLYDNFYVTKFCSAELNVIVET